MGYGIAALMGLLGGAGTGAYKGVDAGIADSLHQDQLAEQTRHNKAVEEGPQVPLAQFYNILGAKVPEGVDPNAKVSASLVGHGFGAAERERARVAETERQKRVSGALGEIQQRDTQVPFAPMTDVERLQALYNAGAHKEDIAALNDVLYPKPVSVAADAKLVQPRTGAVIAEGNQKTKAPNDKAKSIMAGMEGELNDKGEPMWIPGTPEYQREYYRRYAGTQVVPEHGSVRSNADLLSGSTPNAPKPAPTAPPKQPGLEPGEIAHTPGKVSSGDMEKAAATLTAIAGFRGLADDIDRVAPDVRAKLRLWIMRSLQEQNILSVNQFLTPEEAATVSNLAHLQVRYQQAMGGLRGSGSPENYKVYYNLMGNAAAGQESTQLRAISDQLQTQYENENKVRQSQRVRPTTPVSDAAKAPPTSVYSSPASQESPAARWLRERGKR